MTTGWAFLVARGRRQGHRARLVPDLLVKLGLAGLVEEGRSADTPAGRVIVISRTHRIRPDDIGNNQVLDEHGRPLDIIYGLVCIDVPLADIAESDLDTALAQALPAYRRFLADESLFLTEVSTPFPLRSAAAQPPPAPAPRLAPSPAPTSPPAPAPQPPGRRPSRAAVVAGATGALAAVLLLLLFLVPRTASPPTSPTPSPSASPTPAPPERIAT